MRQCTGPSAQDLRKVNADKHLLTVRGILICIPLAKVGRDWIAESWEEESWEGLVSRQQLPPVSQFPCLYNGQQPNLAMV